MENKTPAGTAGQSRRELDRLAALVKRELHKHDDANEPSAIHARVCTESCDGIDAMARDIGCSRAAMLDAWGHMLASPTVRRQLLDIDPTWPAVAVKARHIDADRRDRRPDRNDG